MKHVFTTLLMVTALSAPAMTAQAQSSGISDSTMGTSMDSGMASDSTSGTTGVNSESATGDALANSVPGSVLSESNIRDIQQSLNTEGYFRGSVDGVFGPDTVAALRQFQLDNGLESNGLVTGRTLDTLGVQLSAADSARIDASGGILANQPVGSGVAGTTTGTAGNLSSSTSTSSGTTTGTMSTPGASTMSTPGASTMSTPGASTMGGNMGSSGSSGGNTN